MIKPKPIGATIEMIVTDWIVNINIKIHDPNSKKQIVEVKVSAILVSGYFLKHKIRGIMTKMLTKVKGKGIIVPV